jgi:hypothetical protein
VEIECHLAECRQCQKERDRVAAVRDRITALLIDAVPERAIAAPPFEQLVARRHERILARRLSVGRLARIGLAAASLAGAVGAGWWTRGRLDGRIESAAPALTVAVAPPAAPVAAEPPPAEPASPPATDRTLAAVGPVQTIAGDRPIERPMTGPTDGIGVARSVGRVAERQIVQVNSVVADDELVALDGLWQSVGWQEAAALSGGNLPRIEGLPVLDVQVQRGQADERPLVIVAQQHPSGRMIHTIEGPYDRVTALLDKAVSSGANQLHVSSPTLTPPDYIATGSELPRRSLRVLAVTGNFSADSLNALARGIDLRE